MTDGIRIERVTKCYGSQVLFTDIDLHVRDGEFLVIVGPSGCGKSTLMRIVAGIEPVSAGRVTVGGRDVTHAHPGDRGIGMVFQDYALYPHLSVEGNLAFGLRAHRVPKDVVRQRIADTSRALGLADQLRKKPGQLSGGQRQRVALGRAMIREPAAYLMDEPLSNLDAALRVQMRAELIEFHRRTEGTVLYVTHDQVEAMTMGHRVAVLNDGEFAQIGTPAEIYEQPADEFVATFLGSPRMNLLDATARADADRFELSSGDVRWRLPRELLPDDLPESVRIGFRPESVRVRADTASPSFELEATVSYGENLGNERILHLRDHSGRALVARVPPRTGPRDGEHATFHVPLTDLHLFGPDGRACWHGTGLATGDEPLPWSA
ncbi:ABC transporter ATP-binding protein [Nonomuraea sp. NPDC049695]|uniref:ABC transporter ATP-binding protein n=1 Tax=Nonomuraea sp. NPDC049695 TaxID=3154734 RepID=UPI003417538B